MEVLQNRIDSFQGKRLKKGGKLYKWPHPKSFAATTTSLAEAGFYFDPSADDPDNTTCFTCQKALGDWEQDDDPFDLHYEKCGKRCAWASLRCGLKYDITERGGFVSSVSVPLPILTGVQVFFLQRSRADIENSREDASGNLPCRGWMAS